MKYEVLHKVVGEQRGLILRLTDYPAKIVIPTKGYAVMLRDSVYTGVVLSSKEDFVATVDYWLRVREETPESAIAPKFLQFLFPWPDNDYMHVYPVDVYASRDFAMGVAQERSTNPYDIAAKKIIWMQGRKDV